VKHLAAYDEEHAFFTQLQQDINKVNAFFMLQLRQIVQQTNQLVDDVNENMVYGAFLN